jgi:hypothetical protein
VLDSACSSRALCLLLTAATLLGLAACAGVRPEDKEHLAEPAMTWGDEGVSEQHEQHVLDNREGSTGGGETRGGGCGCN